MSRYTLQQRAQLLLWFAKAQGDFNRFAPMIHFELGDNAVVPAKKTVNQWERIFLETGSVDDLKPVRQK